MKANDHSFFQNRECAYFPCHEGIVEDFNCLFCYCPLYTLGDQCGGNFRYTEAGVKDCSGCLIPHCPQGYDYMLSKFCQVSALAAKNRCNKK